MKLTQTKRPITLSEFNNRKDERKHGKSIYFSFLTLPNVFVLDPGKMNKAQLGKNYSGFLLLFTNCKAIFKFHSKVHWWVSKNGLQFSTKLFHKFCTVMPRNRTQFFNFSYKVFSKQFSDAWKWHFRHVWSWE